MAKSKTVSLPMYSTEMTFARKQRPKGFKGWWNATLLCDKLPGLRFRGPTVVSQLVKTGIVAKSTDRQALDKILTVFGDSADTIRRTQCIAEAAAAKGNTGVAAREYFTSVGHKVLFEGRTLDDPVVVEQITNLRKVISEMSEQGHARDLRDVLIGMLGWYDSALVSEKAKKDPAARARIFALEDCMMGGDTKYGMGRYEFLRLIFELDSTLFFSNMSRPLIPVQDLADHFIALVREAHRIQGAAQFASALNLFTTYSGNPRCSAIFGAKETPNTPAWWAQANIDEIITNGFSPTLAVTLERLSTNLASKLR